MSVFDFESLNEHHAHNVCVVNYVDPFNNPINVSVECMDCNAVLLSYDKKVENRTVKDPVGLKKFKVYCTETVEYEVEVLAKNSEEAIAQVENDPPEYSDATNNEFTSFVASEVKDER